MGYKLHYTVEAGDFDEVEDSEVEGKADGYADAVVLTYVTRGEGCEKHAVFRESPEGPIAVVGDVNMSVGLCSVDGYTGDKVNDELLFKLVGVWMCDLSQSMTLSDEKRAICETAFQAIGRALWRDEKNAKLAKDSAAKA